MQITKSDVILSNGKSVNAVLKELGGDLPMELSVRNGKARLGLPDDYYKSSNDRGATTQRIANGLRSFVNTIDAICAACPEDAGLISPRTYRVVDGQQRSTFAIWFNPDAEQRTNATSTAVTLESQTATLVEELLAVNPGQDLSALNSNPAVALGQLKVWLRQAKASNIEAASQETEEQHDDEGDETVIAGV